MSDDLKLNLVEIKGKTIAQGLLVLMLGVALWEVGMHYWIQWQVPKPSEWQQAANFIRHSLQPGDGLTVAPAWADPLLRRYLGDKMTLSDAGRSDNARYGRLWALAIYNKRPHDAPSSRPEFNRAFGRVSVLRWKLNAPTVVDDVVEYFADAHANERIEVSRLVSDRSHPCFWNRQAAMSSGGLSTGPMWPSLRFECDAARPWLWVGATVNEDLHLKPRRCVWQHPQGSEPISAEVHDVRLGESLIFYGGLYYEHERDLARGPVFAKVKVRSDLGAFESVFEHRDGDGWKRMHLATPGMTGHHGSVRVETWAPDPNFRSLCWAASTRRTKSGF